MLETLNIFGCVGLMQITVAEDPRTNIYRYVTVKHNHFLAQNKSSSHAAKWQWS